MNQYVRDRAIFDAGRPVEPAHIAGYNARVSANLYTGDAARDLAKNLLSAPPRDIAVDCETVGLDVDKLKIKCVTIAAFAGDAVYALLLDPRRDDDYRLIRDLFRHSTLLIFHNAPFDIPSLYQNGLMTVDDINKVADTLVAARLTYPGDATPKSLEKLSERPDLLSLDAGSETMSTAFTAAGFKTQALGFANFDIDRPIYCIGAMSDTAVTLRLWYRLIDRAVEWLTSNPFNSATTPKTRDDALRIFDREQTVNRVMLRRSAVGIAVDRDYLKKYLSDHEATRDAAVQTISAAVGDDKVGNGGAVVEHLHAAGLLPSSWPTTATGRLKADADNLEQLDHPLAKAHLDLARLTKVANYLHAVDDVSTITGRVHPEVGVLKAVSGRMSYSNPALQQFSADARPILVPDTPGASTGWSSIDWSSIEPVVMANCAGDDDFIGPFNAGHDLYIPTAKVAGLIPADMPESEAKDHPGRKTAKIVVLAGMYGQGRRLLAKNLGVSEDDAAAIQNSMKRAMPTTWGFMDALKYAAEDTRLTMTADGRLLPIPVGPDGNTKGYVAVNYFCQGSAYSVLAEAIANIERAGLGDVIQLAVHDELVVDTEAVDDVRHIMQTAPEWLTAFAGRDVHIKTDMNPLPDSWLYV